MEKLNSEEEEEAKKKFREEMGVDPDQLLDTMKRFMELYSRIVLLQFPLTDDLKEAMKKLFEKQYPGIKPYIQIWHVNWVFEAMEGVANTLSIDLVNFFEKLEKGENYRQGYDNYDQYIELYTKPYVARKMVIDYNQLNLSDELLKIYEQIVEEEYQENLIGFKELDILRNEFLAKIYEVVVTYFDAQFDELTPEELIHYDIIVGMGYEDYFDACKELNYYLVEEKIQDFPGLGYYEFMLEECKKIQNTTL